MASLNTMVKQIAGLDGTKDITEWEQSFITSILQKTNNGDNTTSLTEKQIDSLESIYERHFAS